MGVRKHKYKVPKLNGDFKLRRYITPNDYNNVLMGGIAAVGFYLNGTHRRKT